MRLKIFREPLSNRDIEEIPLRAPSDNQAQRYNPTTFVFERQLDKTSLPNLNQRKSWFGRRYARDAFIPPVPVIDQQYKSSTVNESVRQPRAARTTDSCSRTGVSPIPNPDEINRKSRRSSLSRKASWRSLRHNYQEMEALPAMPTIPATFDRTRAAHAPESRKNRPVSLSRKSSDDSTTTKSKQRKRRSFWTSSNPDDSDDDFVPPVPALVRDGLSTPESRRSREDRRKDSASGCDATPIVQAKPAPTRRTYTPKNAAAGFLLSTSGASEATRRTFRQSFHIADDEELVCLTDEQRREWEKLRSVMHTFASQDLDRADPSDSDVRSKYSNKQALAALEFGLR